MIPLSVLLGLVLQLLQYQSSFLVGKVLKIVIDVKGAYSSVLMVPQQSSYGYQVAQQYR